MLPLCYQSSAMLCHRMVWWLSSSTSCIQDSREMVVRFHYIKHAGHLLQSPRTRKPTGLTCVVWSLCLFVRIWICAQGLCKYTHKDKTTTCPFLQTLLRTIYIHINIRNLKNMYLYNPWIGIQLEEHVLCYAIHVWRCMYICTYILYICS